MTALNSALTLDSSMNDCLVTLAPTDQVGNAKFLFKFIPEPFDLAPTGSNRIQSGSIRTLTKRKMAALFPDENDILSKENICEEEIPHQAFIWN